MKAGQPTPWTNCQAAVVRWDSDAVTILPTGLDPAISEASCPVGLYALPSRTCPVRRDVDPAGRCVPHGGGGTSASIHAASLWQEHRTLGVRLIGCDCCDGGREPGWSRGGSAINFSEIVLASRYGNATWK